MAKKKVANKTKTPASGKARVELRMEKELFAKITSIADEAEISLNQLMNGLAEWASRHAIQGEPDRRITMDEEVVARRDQPGCVFFGRLVDIGKQYVGPSMPPDEVPYYDESPEDFQSVLVDPGAVFCELDFTVRRVVKEEP